MIELKTTSGSPIKVYDHTPIRDSLRGLGLASLELEELNRFCYGSLPEGSHGAFLVKAEDVASLTPGMSPITLTITGQIATFTHVNLLVTSVRYIERDPLDATNVDGINRKLAIVEVKDRWCVHDSLILKDYNRTSFLLPTSGDDFSSYPDPPESWSTILNHILTNYTSGVTPSLTLSGLPTVNPQNVLSAGSTIKDFFQYVADAHFLVAYHSKSATAGGTIVLTDALQVLADLTITNEPIYASYGHEALPKYLTVLYSIQGHHYSRMRGQVLAFYYDDDDYATDWLKKNDTLTPTNDFLGSNSRFQSDYTDFDHYYPFYHPGNYDTLDADSNTVFTKLLTNLSNRTRRSSIIGYKDVVLLDPSLHTQKIEYKYTDQGLTSFIYSSSPRKLAIEPETNHVTRGFEYVPPVLYGTVTSPSGSNPLGGYAPQTDNAEIELPAEGALNTKTVSIYNASTQQMFENDKVAVYYSIQRKKYIFLDRCERLFQFILLTNWFGGLAIAIRRTTEGVSTGKRVLVRDPLGIFDYLARGDVGWMQYTVLDAYYAVQAGCDSIPNPPVDPTGACIVWDECIEGVTEADCLSAAGVYQGDGSSCP